MMKRYVLCVLVCCLCGAVSAAPADTTTVSFDKTTHNFGNILETDGKVTAVFTITNTGTTALKIKNVIAACGCTKPEWSRDDIAAGKASQIKVTYDPTNLPGMFIKNIKVEANIPTGKAVLTIRGRVTPKSAEADNETDK